MNGHAKTSDDLQQSSVVNGGSKSSIPVKPLFEMSFTLFGRVTVSLPFFALMTCFFSAIIFQYDLVSKTESCSAVPNMVPSISAITGITPQRYIWRVCIALHSAPRFAVAFIYWSYYMERLQQIKRLATLSVTHEWAYRVLAKFLFYIYIIENACLVGVTFISNVENYPIHEKIFIVFMVSSLLYELLTVVLFRWAHPNMSQTPIIAGSFRTKLVGFVLSMLFTTGLLYYYFMHRWYCAPGAFTMFSTCEYGIAIANMLFHMSACREFGHLVWTLKPLSSITTTTGYIPAGFVPECSANGDRNGNNNLRKSN